MIMMRRMLPFQSTLPRGERPCSFSNVITALLFQSTLPRGERPCRTQWSASGRAHFNPRSREGSDGALHAHQRRGYDFNPRSREGSDFQYHDRRYHPSCISIHAPARGATKPSDSSMPSAKYFNPRSREGSDFDTFLVIAATNQFQSTLPRGERHIRSRGTFEARTFQSTLPRGERLVNAI